MQNFDREYEKNLLDLMVRTFDQPEAERRAFLESQSDNPTLIEDVLETLGGEDTLGDFLETPALVELRKVDPTTGEVFPPELDSRQKTAGRELGRDG